MLRRISVTFALLAGVCLGVVGQDVKNCCGACFDGFCEQLSDLGKISRLAEVSDQLFIGKVVHAELMPCCEGLADVTFRVRKRWKGPDVNLVTVRTGGSCATPFPFSIGREYLMAAVKPQGQETVPKEDCRFTPMEVGAAHKHIIALEEWQRAKADAEAKK